MDAWLPFGRMPRLGNHLAGPGRLAGRQSSLHEIVILIFIKIYIKYKLRDYSRVWREKKCLVNYFQKTIK